MNGTEAVHYIGRGFGESFTVDQTDRLAVSGGAYVKLHVPGSVIPGLTSLPRTPIRGNPGISGSSFDFAPFDCAQDRQDGEPACSELVEPVEPRLGVYPALYAGLRYGRDDGLRVVKFHTSAAADRRDGQFDQY